MNMKKTGKIVFEIEEPTLFIDLLWKVLGYKTVALEHVKANTTNLEPKQNGMGSHEFYVHTPSGAMKTPLFVPGI